MESSSNKKRTKKTKVIKAKKTKPAVPEKIIKTKAKAVRKPKKTVKIAAPEPQIEKNIPDYNAQYSPSPIISKFESQKGYELPSDYGESRIVLMVRDPYWIHAYWDLPPSKKEELRSIVGSEIFNRSRKILRVYDVSDVNFTGLNAWKSFDINLGDEAKNWYINVGEPNRSWCVDIGYLTPSGRFLVAARSNVVSTPRDGMSDVVDEEWMTIDWEKMYALSGGFGLGKSSGDIKELFKNRLKEEMASGFVSSWGKPADILSKKNDFWLVANAELIVYGATLPDAKLSIQGFPVKLRPDGTFTMRFALPDGKQEIPIVAQDAQGEHKRSITPVVEKRTQ